MPAKMSEYQLNFWRELFAPFPRQYVKEAPSRGTGKKLLYIDARALMNRLDSVCGPAGWTAEYRPFGGGFICRVGILCPGKTEADPEAWIYKEDGGGEEDMSYEIKTWDERTRQKVGTGEIDPQKDNGIKAGFTNSFRRVMGNAWPMSRELYGSGIPDWFDAAAKPPGESLPGPRSSQAEVDHRQPVAKGGGQYAAKLASTPDSPTAQSSKVDTRTYEEVVAAASSQLVGVPVRVIEDHLLEDAIEAGYLENTLRDSDDKLADCRDLYLRRREWTRKQILGIYEYYKKDQRGAA